MSESREIIEQLVREKQAIVAFYQRTLAERDLDVAQKQQALRELEGENAKLTTELARLRKSLGDLREIHGTFDGGYREQSERDIFHHGIETACNVVDAALGIVKAKP